MDSLQNTPHRPARMRPLREAFSILTADWHLRAETPECRMDDFISAQWRKVRYVVDLANKLNCSILHAGDLFDSWKSLPHVEARAIEELNRLKYSMLIVAGNHDLPKHNLSLMGQGSLSVLIAARVVKWLGTFETDQFNVRGFSYGEDVVRHVKGEMPMVYVVHRLVCTVGDGVLEGCSVPALIREVGPVDVLLTGDNHRSFTAKIRDTVLVNPGSLMRLTAAQIDHQPMVYIWGRNGNIVPHALPIEQGVISREHIRKVQERDERMETFIARLRDDYEVSFSFKSNMKNFLRVNKVRKGVCDIVWQTIDT